MKFKTLGALACALSASLGCGKPAQVQDRPALVEPKKAGNTQRFYVIDKNNHLHVYDMKHCFWGEYGVVGPLANMDIIVDLSAYSGNIIGFSEESVESRDKTDQIRFSFFHKKYGDPKQRPAITIEHGGAENLIVANDYNDDGKIDCVGIGDFTFYKGPTKLELTLKTLERAIAKYPTDLSDGPLKDIFEKARQRYERLRQRQITEDEIGIASRTNASDIYEPNDLEEAKRVFQLIDEIYAAVRRCLHGEPRSIAVEELPTITNDYFSQIEELSEIRTRLNQGE